MQKTCIPRSSKKAATHGSAGSKRSPASSRCRDSHIRYAMKFQYQAITGSGDETSGVAVSTVTRPEGRQRALAITACQELGL